jgi:membrane protein
MKELMVRRFAPFAWTKKILSKLSLVWRAVEKFGDDNGLFLSSGIAFSLLICLVPLFLLLLSLVGTYLYGDREVLKHIHRYFENAVPALDPRMMKNIFRIMEDWKIVGGIGIAGLIWTSTWVFSSLRTALNMIFQVEKGQGKIGGMAIDLLMILLYTTSLIAAKHVIPAKAGIQENTGFRVKPGMTIRKRLMSLCITGTFLLMSVALTSLVTYLHRYRFNSPLDLGPVIHFSLQFLIPFLFTFWMFFLIYKIIPNKKIQFKVALQAASFTSLLWEAAKQGFAWYILHLGGYPMIYGSLSTLVILVLWVY